MRLDHLLSKRRSRGCFTVELSKAKADGNGRYPVAMRLGETPVPIPNTTVKTQTADGTALETMLESRWPPEQKNYSVLLMETLFYIKLVFTSDQTLNSCFVPDD